MSLTRVWSANTSRMYSAGARCSIACPSLPQCSRSIARSLSHHFQSLALMGNAPSLGAVTVNFTMGHFLRFRPIDASACPTNAYPQPVSQSCQACSARDLVTQPPLPAPHRTAPPSLGISLSATVNCPGPTNSCIRLRVSTDRTITSAPIQQFDPFLLIMLSRLPR
jgi:hypothetical protein